MYHFISPLSLPQIVHLSVYSFVHPPPPIHLDRVEECEEDSIEEEKEEEEEETPVTESDSDEQEGANETTSRYFRT